MFKHTKTIITVLCVLTIGAILHRTGLLVSTVHAIPIIPGGGAPSSGSLGDVLKDLIEKIATINTFMHVLLLIILQFLQYLLQADFFNDTTMMSGLFTIWKLCRDIMNVIFAVSLIAVSFYVIITAKSDMIKEKLSQFVIAVILVNMSWFFPRVIIDMANVLSATVYSVPNLLPAPMNTCMRVGKNGTPEPCKVITNVLLLPKSVAEEAAFCAPYGANCVCYANLECHVTEDYATAIATMAPAHAMINGLAVSFARITELTTVPEGVVAPGGPVGAGDAVRTSLQIGLSIMMGFLVQIAVVLPLIGMAVGFLIRIIILWVTTAFMPFSFIGYMVNGKLGTNVFGFEIDIWDEFVKAAFLPATVGVPFVIGFIMLTTVSQVPAPPGMPFDISVPMITDIKSWWAMLWLFAAVGIIWKGSFSALSKSKLVGGMTEKIRAFGEYVGGGIAQLPLITPLPLPGLKGANIGTAIHAPKLLSDAVRASASGISGKSFGEQLSERFNIGGGGGGGKGGKPGNLNTQELADKLKLDADTNTKKVVDAIKLINAGSTDPAQFKAIRDTLANLNTNPNVDPSKFSNRETFEALRDIANKQGAGALHDQLKTIEDILKTGKAT